MSVNSLQLSTSKRRAPPGDHHGGYFYDAQEEMIPSGSSDCGSETTNSSSICSSRSSSSRGFFKNNNSTSSSYVKDSLNYDFWIRDPKSIDERRNDFVRRSGFSLDNRWHIPEYHGTDLQVAETGPLPPPLRTLRHLITEEDDFDDQYSGIEDDESNRSSKKSTINKMKKKVIGMPRRRRSCSSTTLLSSSDPIFSLEEFYKAIGVPDWLKYLRQMGRLQNNNDNSPESFKKSCTVGWFKRFNIPPPNKATAASFKKDLLCPSSSSPTDHCRRPKRVHVHAHKKRCKELSCQYQMQDISAHQGSSILTMKFSTEGDHLATGGEDGIICIWKLITEDDHSLTTHKNDFDILMSSNSSIHQEHSTKGAAMEKAAAGHNVVVDKQQHQRKSSSHDSSSSLCNTVIPKKVPRILKKPVHDYHGHEGAVLDLSWSTTKFVLSCSVDKTVRLWRLGCDLSIRVFPHREYVTCVEFNPMDDNYFVSGSVDRIVRIWSINGSKVVNWIDLKDVVTAICYQPDGEGIIVGSRAGRCQFYEFVDDSLSLKGEAFLHGKKKSKPSSSSSCKRLNSIQVSPNDPNKLVVTSLDSHIWILRGTEVVYKLKGLGRAATQLSACFTYDGEHVISTSENHGVHIWNCSGNWGTILPSKPKTIEARESFFSPNALLSIPWYGSKYDEEPSGTNSKLWRLVIVSGGSDGHIRTYHNYGLPIRR